jgi:hypothetical protein
MTSCATQTRFLPRQCDLYQHLLHDSGAWVAHWLVIAPEEVIGNMVMANQGADLQSSTFDQYLAYELASGDWLKDHIATIRKVYASAAMPCCKPSRTFMP